MNPIKFKLAKEALTNVFRAIAVIVAAWRLCRESISVDNRTVGAARTRFYGGTLAFLHARARRLVDKFNQGLPQNLSGAPPARASINHGFKGMQISVSAWAAEALKLTMPAASFSRSTESHNQDKVSVGTIAARDCLRILELSEQVAAAMVLAAHQALQLRRRQGELDARQLPGEARAFVEKVAADFAFLEEDRRLDQTLQRTVGSIRAKAWNLYRREE